MCMIDRYKVTLANQAEAITDVGHFFYDEVIEQYLFVSPGLARILGVDEDDLILSSATRHMDLARVHEQDRQYVKKVYDHFFINKDTWQVEYRIVHAGGEVRWLKEMGKAFETNGEIVQKTVGVIQDITEKKNIEQALLQSLKALLIKTPNLLVRINAHRDAIMADLLPLIAQLESVGARDIVLVVTPEGP